MGLLESLKEYLYLGSGEKRKRIYRETIKRIPISFFTWRARVKVGGEAKDLSGENLRDFIADLARNGVSLSQLDSRLKQAGLRDNQYVFRQRILREIEKIIKEGS